MTTSEPTHAASARHLAGIFLVSAAALLLEVSLTRLLAVTLWYHFAFMIISGGLLGFGAAAVTVAVSARLRSARLDTTLARLAGLLALGAVGTFALAQTMPLRPFSLAASGTQVLYLALTYLLLTSPFYVAGLVVSLLLARRVSDATRLYAFDLAGAGLGSVAALFVLEHLGGPGALVVAGGIAAVAMAVLATERPERAAGVGLALLAFALAPSAERWLPLRISSNKGLARVDHAAITRWSSVGRIDVLTGTGGGGARILIDGGVAATRVPGLAALGGELSRFRVPPEGMRAARAAIGDAPRVLIIGSGGGYEIASALALGASHVTGVELNSAIVEVVRDELAEETAGLFRDERVEVVVDEGRSFVRRPAPAGEERPAVDLLVCVHTISNAAWSSGALSLAENYVLTVEALEDFLGRLSDGGVLWMTRPEAQLPRLVATARAALVARGVADPTQHIVAYRLPLPESRRRAGQQRSFLGGVIVSKSPLDPTRAAAALAALRRDRLELILAPDVAPRIDRDAYAAALASPAAGPARFADFGDITPCTDERPYFNQRVPWSEIGLQEIRETLGRGQGGRMAMEDAPVAEVAVLIVLGWATLFSLALIALPLLVWQRRRRTEPTRAPLPRGLLVRLALYFVALGLAYITVEIVLIQRLGLFVGRPEYALAVVLGSMLVASGLGSSSATRFASRPRRAAVLALAAALGLLALSVAVGPGVTRALLGLPLAARMLTAGALVAPIGFALGMPLPLGLRALPSDAPHLPAWLFGLNCAASVIGSSLTVVLSSGLGFTGTLALAGLMYALAAAAIAPIGDGVDSTATSSTD